MIAMSRKRGKSDETSIATAVVNTNSAQRARAGTAATSTCGSTPKARMKTNTTTRLSAEVEQARQHDRERDHEPRELRLAHDRLLADDRGDRRDGGLLEEARTARC